MTEKKQEEKKEEVKKETSSPEGKSKAASENNAKVWSIVGYIFPILFFIPLVMEDLKNNEYAKFHANQQLVLLITAIAVNIVGSVIPILGWFIILPFGGLAVLIIAIIGIVNAVQEKKKALPIIGKIEIIK